MDRIDVLTAMDEAANYADGGSAPVNGDAVREARDAVAELIEADTEHDSARESLVELNRRVAENGWIDVEHDALRQAGERFVRAQSRRYAAIARVQP